MESFKKVFYCDQDNKKNAVDTSCIFQGTADTTLTITGVTFSASYLRIADARAVNIQNSEISIRDSIDINAGSVFVGSSVFVSKGAWLRATSGDIKVDTSTLLMLESIVDINTTSTFQLVRSNLTASTISVRACESKDV